ncbi:uncharacterized protein [Rutidosis leptorrhynchoides]|uniref:uncharacterized protein n=1 Tax=Rutidosis leptorrhynchoides TaxID=125765 RepID=UPI003A98F779
MCIYFAINGYFDKSRLKLCIDCFVKSLTWRLRGNQRDRDRERAQARAGGKAKQPKTDGLTPEQRRERDAKALQEKLARKAAKDSAGAKGGKDGMKTKQ